MTLSYSLKKIVLSQHQLNNVFLVAGPQDLKLNILIHRLFKHLNISVQHTASQWEMQEWIWHIEEKQRIKSVGVF